MWFKSLLEVSNLIKIAPSTIISSYLMNWGPFCECYVLKLVASIGIGIEVLVFWPVLVLVLVLKI